MNEPVVVVGNGVAGFACASRLAEHGVPVTMIGPGLPHDRPPLSKRALATGRMPLLADAAKLVERGVHHLDGVVTAVDLEARRLTVALQDAPDPVDVEASRLVWATGLRYPRPPVPGMEGAHENASGLGMLALSRAAAPGGRRVVVVGAGLIGTETAATLARMGNAVVLVDMLDRPLARFLPEATAAALAMLVGLGVTFHGDVRIEAVAGGAVRTSTHGDLPCDVVVSAAGFRSSLPPALADDPRRLAVDADASLRVEGLDDVWACGDCVTFPHPRFGRIGIPHWDHALWSGRHVADTIAGGNGAYVRDPYFFSDIGPLRLQQVGHAPSAVEWQREDGLRVGRDAAGRPACILLVNAAPRLREARELLAG
jgi:3-phenylpropionate/trans-cinnamate dioxygenase ferredoxin reductase subunit